MHSLACIICKSVDDFKESFLADENFKSLVNKFRCCIFFADAETISGNYFHKNSVVCVHEILPTYLTYIRSENQELVHPQEPLVNSAVKEYWIAEIDIWIGLPKAAKEQVLRLASNVICHDDLTYFKK